MKLIIALLFALLMASGCTSMQTMSSYARSGDTVMVAIGGSETHVTTPMLKISDLTVTVTDALGVIHPVKVKRVFRAYPDPTSFYNHSGWDVTDTYQSQWMAVLDFVDPATDLPLPLAQGMANITISGPNLQNHYMYGWSWTNGDLAAVPIEIIPGEGTIHSLNYMQPVGRDAIQYIEPMSQVLVTPSREVIETDGFVVAGGEFEFSYPTSLLQNAEINVATVTPDKKTQLAVRYITNSDDTTTLKVIVMNPNGFSYSNMPLVTRTNSPFKALAFSLYFQDIPDLTDTTWQNHIQLVSARYIDIQGNTIPDLTAVMSKIK